MIGNGDWEEKL